MFAKKRKRLAALCQRTPPCTHQGSEVQPNAQTNKVRQGSHAIHPTPFGHFFHLDTNAMKQPRLEFLARRMREHHRHHPWRLSAGGLYVPHTYDHKTSDTLSYWDDVGFILNGRRFMVWWHHPRDVYANAIESLAWERLQAERGDQPDADWLFDGATKHFRMVGKSKRRKKFSSYTSRQPSDEQRAYYARLNAIEAEIRQTGIELTIQPSWTWRRYTCFMGVDIVAPLEVRNEQEVAQLADLVRQLAKRQTTLTERFGDKAYGKADWLSDVRGRAS